MSETRTIDHPFIDHLEKLRDGDDRGALAALRRGLGREPGAAPEVFRYVVPYMPADPSWRLERVYYLVAALFAAHPAPGGHGNLGEHLRAIVHGDANREAAVERRFSELLAAHPDDVADHLRGVVSLLRAHEVPVDWRQLFHDLRRWSFPESRAAVQREWARAFWGRSAPDASSPSASEP